MKITAETISIRDAATLLGQTERHLRRQCAAGRIGGAIRKEGQWRIPRSFDPRLNGVEMPEHKGLDRMNEVPVDKLAEARRKAGIVAAAEQFAAAAVAGGGNRSEAMNAFCLQNQIGKRTLYRWIAGWRSEGLLGLVDERGKRKYEGDLISAEAWAWFKSAWLDPRQPTVKMVWQAMVFYSQQHNFGWTIPALRTMYDLIDKRIPMPVQVLHREGQGAYDARCAPYVITDPDSIEPGAVWTGDHHEFNAMIRHRGQWCRPWISAWLDQRSRAIVGHHVSLSPNQTTILLAFRRGCEQYGPPDRCHIDNGKDFDSELWTGTTKQRRRVLGKGYIDEPGVRGLYAIMNIAVSFAIPYHPQSKPIERWFDTLDQQFTKTIQTYCGKDTDRKPEDLAEYLKTHAAIEKGLDLEGFSALVERYIAAYNATAHTGAGMESRSPNEVIATRQGRRVLAEGVLDLICRIWSGELTVSKNGVRFRNLWYGQYDTNLLMHQGRKVRVSYDPADLSSVQVYDLSYNLIAIARQAQMVAFGTGADEEALREAMAKKARARKTVKGFRDASRTANMDLTSLTIASMEDRSRPDPRPEGQPALRPAATVLDDQVAEVRRREATIAVRRAAGAEGITQVPDLDLDWRNLKRKEPELPELHLDWRNLKKKESPELNLFGNG